MAKPVLIINSHDYAPLVEELSISLNDLDAEGSGRDVQTGEMFRTRIATKLKVSVKLLRLKQPQMQQLLADLSAAFYSAKVIHPSTGAQVTRQFYTSTIPCGAQRASSKKSGSCPVGSCSQSIFSKKAFRSGILSLNATAFCTICQEDAIARPVMKISGYSMRPEGFAMKDHSV